MPRPDPALLREWNARLAAENLPEELPLIPRAHRPGSDAAFESDLDADALDQPPPLPRTKRSGRRPDYDIAAAREQAEALIRDGCLTPLELQTLALWIAGVPVRQIVDTVAPGHSTRWLRDQVLGPLMARAEIPTSWKPKKSRPSRTGLKYRKRQNTTPQGYE